jgi:hypothetical protein
VASAGYCVPKNKSPLEGMQVSERPQLKHFRKRLTGMLPSVVWPLACDRGKGTPLKEVCSKTYYDDMQAHMGKSSQTF